VKEQNWEIIQGVQLRVKTVQLRLVATPREVYDGADADAVLCLLTHKTLRATADEGVEEAHALLQDWLIILTACYNRHVLRLSRSSFQQHVGAANSTLKTQRNARWAVLGFRFRVPYPAVCPRLPAAADWRLTGSCNWCCRSSWTLPRRRCAW
jgi:Sec23/Sec24 helical domain